MATHRKGPAVLRYVHVQPRAWTDEDMEFDGWARLPPPHPFTLWQFFLTSPFASRVPGMIIGGRAAMAEFLGWEVEDFDACFAALSARGKVIADWRARLAYLPTALRQPENRPTSTSAAVTWRRELYSAPECALRTRIENDVRSLLRTLGGSFLPSFDQAARAKLATPQPTSLPSGTPSPSPSPSPSLAPAPALALPPPPSGEEVQEEGGGKGKVKGRGKDKPVQLEIADRVDPPPAAPPAPLEPAPAPGTPLTVAAFLEALATCSAGRFQISHKNGRRELRNAAAETLTCGLPQLLWDQLRAELVREAPDLALVQRAGALLAARDPADRSGRRFAFWGHWLVVTADNLRGRLHELLTAAAALVPAAPAELPRVTAEPNTPEYYEQLRALSEAQYGRR